MPYVIVNEVSLDCQRNVMLLDMNSLPSDYADAVRRALSSPHKGAVVDWNISWAGGESNIEPIETPIEGIDLIGIVELFLDGD